MGWVEKKLKERDEVYWTNLRKAMPLIQQRADATLSTLGYHPSQFTALVVPNGEGGDVIWTVKYWTLPGPQGVETARHGNLEVSLNNQGKVRRIMKYEGGQESLVYGKDERITEDMTPEQVLERLGEPDYKGSPPGWARREGDTELWRYNIHADRTMRIEVFFKNGKVSFFSTSGE